MCQTHEKNKCKSFVLIYKAYENKHETYANIYQTYVFVLTYGLGGFCVGFVGFLGGAGRLAAGPCTCYMCRRRIVCRLAGRKYVKKSYICNPIHLIMYVKKNMT